MVNFNWRYTAQRLIMRRAQDSQLSSLAFSVFSTLSTINSVKERGSHGALRSQQSTSSSQVTRYFSFSGAKSVSRSGLIAALGKEQLDEAW